MFFEEDRPMAVVKNMAKSTPGPWRRSGAQVIGSDGDVVATCRQAKPRNTMTAIKNAQLIAMAPTLLECVQQAILLLGRDCPEGGRTDAFCKGATQIITEATKDY
jgi:hypothetical protein